MTLFDPLTESVFTWAAPPIKFGLGALDDLGHEAALLGARTCLILTDRGVAATGLAERARCALQGEGLSAEVFDQVEVEPTDQSVEKAAAFAAQGSWDALIALGGGSAIDTAKAVNLLTTQPGELLDYVAAPVGGGRSLEGPLLPLIAVPTTAGTGSESTPICVVDLLGLRLKAGISHPRLRPTLAVIDPLTTLSLPPEVTAASGMDVLSHALESYTAKRFDARPRRQVQVERDAFSGANPISDLWCEHAIELVGRHLRPAVANGYDLRARYAMMLASTYAGLGFGSAGTHLPHANAYPIAGQAHDYQAAGYPSMPMVPHGQAVASTAAPSFRFTYPACPERHQSAASLLLGRPADHDAGAEALPGALRSLMTDLDMPLGIRAFGFDAGDLRALVEGTLKQARQLAVSPRTVTVSALEHIYQQSLAAS